MNDNFFRIVSGLCAKQYPQPIVSGLCAKQYPQPNAEYKSTKHIEGDELVFVMHGKIQTEIRISGSHLKLLIDQIINDPICYERLMLRMKYFIDNPSSVTTTVGYASDNHECNLLCTCVHHTYRLLTKWSPSSISSTFIPSNI